MPEPRDHVSLHGIRAFEAVARLRSIKDAASELCVTASAVSHQLRQLETNVGKKLFVRRHNGVELSPEGASFFRDVAPGIRSIVDARRALERDEAAVTIKSPYSLATRWLIPQLPKFQARHPHVRVSVQTKNYPIVLGPGIDVALPYRRAGRDAPDGVLLLPDHTLAVGSPALLESVAPRRRGLVSSYPLISTTVDDWNWQVFARESGIDAADLRIAYRFDTDQAAVEACLRGIGVTILAQALIEDELASGLLVPVGTLPMVTLGEYWAVASQPRRRPVELLFEWLRVQTERYRHADLAP